MLYIFFYSEVLVWPEVSSWMDMPKIPSQGWHPGDILAR